MSCLFRYKFLNVKKLLVAFVVFSGVYCDAGDLDRVFLSPQPAGYVYPQPPVQFDEERPTHIYLPLPPIFADEAPVYPAPHPPPENYPPQGSFPVYLPPTGNEVFAQIPSPYPPPQNDDTVVIPALPFQSPALYPPTAEVSSGQALSPPQFKIENMSCVQGFSFRATFKMANDLSQFPVVDDATEGCVTSLTGSMFKIDLENFNSMLKCGVKRCKSTSAPQEQVRSSGNGNFRSAAQGSENMCVVLRMPTVRGVRLPEDQLLTLVCKPQERVVSRTRHVRLGSNKIFQNSRGRSTNGFTATGGTQKDLRSRISIFRKRSGTNIFDQNVQPESVIQLGEELVLRAVVNDGDGWQGSQIGPVLITGVKSKKSALLVNQNGCVNPVMKSICPQQPTKVTSLATEVHFRAFLFQESPQGDEMVVSVKMQGCLHLQDCQRVDSCRDDITSARSKRDVMKFNSTSRPKIRKTNINEFSQDVKNWESELFFRVETLPPKRNRLSQEKLPVSETQENLYWFVVYFTGLIFLSIAVVVVLLAWQLCSKNSFIKNGNFPI